MNASVITVEFETEFGVIPKLKEVSKAGVSSLAIAELACSPSPCEYKTNEVCSGAGICGVWRVLSLVSCYDEMAILVSLGLLRNSHSRTININTCTLTPSTWWLSQITARGCANASLDTPAGAFFTVCMHSLTSSRSSDKCSIPNTQTNWSRTTIQTHSMRTRTNLQTPSPLLHVTLSVKTWAFYRWHSTMNMHVCKQTIYCACCDSDGNGNPGTRGDCGAVESNYHAHWDTIVLFSWLFQEIKKWSEDIGCNQWNN